MKIKTQDDITYEYIREYMTYDPSTGECRLKRSVKHSRKKIGDLVGSVQKNGYLVASISNIRVLLHRLIWLYMTGKFPVEYIDHINGNKGDNRFSNLREATAQQNNFNSSLSTRNTTGYKGVSYCKQMKKYKAGYKLNKKIYHIGYFDTPEQASAAYINAVAPIHGEYFKEQL